MAEYTITLTAISPSETRVASANFPVTVEKTGDVVRILRWQTLDVEIDEFGRWRPAPAGRTVDDVHAERGSRAATAVELDEFERRYGRSLSPDHEG